MRLLSVYQCVQEYQNEGHGFLRRYRGNSLIEAILAGQFAGLDTMLQVRLCLVDVETLNRLVRQLRSIRFGVQLRVLAIVIVAFMIRLFLLFSISDEQWSLWLQPDRAACIALAVIFCCLIFLWFRQEQIHGEERATGTFLSEWFQDYVQLSPRGGGDLLLAHKLRLARIAEITEGTDRIEVCQRFYLQALAERVFGLRRHLDRWPMIMMIVELAVFLVCFGGLVLVPFVAWLETASSGL